MTFTWRSRNLNPVQIRSQSASVNASLLLCSAINHYYFVFSVSAIVIMHKTKWSALRIIILGNLWAIGVIHDRIIAAQNNNKDLTVYDGNFNGDVRRNKIIFRTKQRERIISSPNGLINNVLVLQTTSTQTFSRAQDDVNSRRHEIYF